MAKFRLTHANYYSTEANNAYWSASLIKSFLDCPARAVAELNGEYVRPQSAALLIGSYVDAAFDKKGSLDAFKAEHPEIFKKDGSLKAEYVKADAMIERAKSDPVFMEYMRGRKQVIKTGTLFGVPFKCKLDVYRKDRIVDLKTVRDFKPIYLPGQGKVNFAEAWHWTTQMAIYQAIEGHKLPCYLACITKEDPPDIAVIEIPQSVMDAELEWLEGLIEEFKAIKAGVVDAPRCDNCAYCRASNKLIQPMSLEYYNEFGNNIEE